MTSTLSAASPKPLRASDKAEVAGLPSTKAFALLALTGAGLLAAGAVNPYAIVERMLNGGGGDVASQPILLDPRTQNPSHGEDLFGTFATWPKPSPSAALILMLGNSQQYTCSLPRGAQADMSHKALVASDLLAAKLATKSAAGSIAVYNGAAPNQTQVEELWQGIYWFKVAERHPAALILASSFDTFRKTGIRHGFQTLLQDENFVAALDGMSLTDRPYSGELSAARKSFAEPQPEAPDEATHQGTFEGWLREHMEALPLYRKRQERRATFMSVLYLARVHLLKLSPTTRRHITGQPLAANFAALNDLVRLARSSSAAVFIYNAPVNPAVSMFYQDEYRLYLDRLRTLADEHGARFADLGDAVPADQWGYFIDGPDPIHFDEQGHRTVADRLDAAFGADLAALATR